MLRLITIILLFILTSCSHKPWQSNPLNIEEVGGYEEIIEEMQQQDCAQGFDADAIIHLRTRLGGSSYQGYFAGLRPDHGKFVVSTPFGQPIFISTINEDKLLIIHVTQKAYSEKEILPYLQEYDLPPSLLDIGFIDIVGGYFPAKFPSPYRYYTDKYGRGLWVQNTTSDHAVLIDFTKKEMMGQRIGTGKEAIDISYERGEEHCSPPEKVVISGLSYGSRIEVILEDGQPRESYTEKTFQIPPPSFFIKLPE